MPIKAATKAVGGKVVKAALSSADPTGLVDLASAVGNGDGKAVGGQLLTAALSAADPTGLVDLASAAGNGSVTGVAMGVAGVAANALTGGASGMLMSAMDLATSSLSSPSDDHSADFNVPDTDVEMQGDAGTLLPRGAAAQQAVHYSKVAKEQSRVAEQQRRLAEQQTQMMQMLMDQQKKLDEQAKAATDQQKKLDEQAKAAAAVVRQQPGQPGPTVVMVEGGRQQTVMVVKHYGCTSFCCSLLWFILVPPIGLLFPCCCPCDTKTIVSSTQGPRPHSHHIAMNVAGVLL